jgi:NAD(P)-dependent dehydrogenase (short-subunit alcohol dehydrogenase family)
MSTRARGTIVLTGAGGQVGSALARRLAGLGPLALLGVDAAAPGPDPQDPVRAFGRVDLLDEQAVRRAGAEIRAALGPIRALVHTVGAHVADVEVQEQPLELVRRMLDANYLAAVGIIRTLLPDLQASASARIVLFASREALHARAGRSAYAASKAALLRFAEALAEEVAPRGVGVCVLMPSTIDTPANRAAAPDADTAGWVTLDQIAALVEFLIDPGSAGIRFAAIPLGD